MKTTRILVGFAAAVCAGLGLHAVASDRQSHAPYAGQQVRDIKSLSAQDVAALRAGQGWGLAKSAELNGYPGPLHVLQLADSLALSHRQRVQVRAIFDAMQASAKAVGQEYLAAERAVDRAFADGAATAQAISRLTASAGRLRAKLRAVHLAAHIETTPLLTPHQRARYESLRGYAGKDGRGHQHQGTHKH
ncbi:MAG: Spy/CpxP family protein refolding chaperone [Hyphomicrobiaceae bacterium]